MAPCQGLCGWETKKEHIRVEKETLLSLVCRYKHSSNTRMNSYQTTAHPTQGSVRCRNQHSAVLGRRVLTIYSKSVALAALTGRVQLFSSTSQTQHSGCEISSAHGPTAQQHMWQQKCVTEAKTSAWQVTTTSSSAHEDPGPVLTSP